MNPTLAAIALRRAILPVSGRFSSDEGGEAEEDGDEELCGEGEGCKSISLGVGNFTCTGIPIAGFARPVLLWGISGSLLCTMLRWW